ncbi:MULTISPECIES: DUF4440 domain-containing protein [Enterobacter]|uniref:DUF4440 domain-containing protein n=1 Tax=Enterobacter vonholyi TaxID=2797505 RepID=A0ABU6E474_9ENTR|nr:MULTISPECIES: DUF4440 domain-containing protein [Enterobacter]MCK7259797.1 DUF4440 domain-containing protein [Enterobacter asburiae]QBN11644.1 DUF4440 domain-containing protein [Enterobacter cloacae complex sp.]MCM7621716.1 DUF4440 domain-containing protein [Enterobacter vonholyi]MEB6410081.1 DUF4440 domain-containing protein [Enterobacter vonholyi]MEB7623739.1 DUF4440 domain-containing protein [Enterobacter vonholyi]
MTPFEHDIIDLHIALEDWLGKGEGDPDALLARFRRDFLMLPPGGVQIDYIGLASFLENQRGSRPGLKIVIDELTTIQSGERGAVLHYRETQTRPDLPVNVRWSTAVLNQEGDRIVWRLLHETAKP